MKNFEVQYRRLLLKHTLSQIDGTDLTATIIVKLINVLTEIRWTWDAVQLQTIINCFRKTRALPLDEETENEVLFAGIEGDMSGVDELVHQIDPSSSASDYIDADADLSTNLTFEDTPNWREELWAIVCEDIPEK